MCFAWNYLFRCQSRRQAGGNGKCKESVRHHCILYEWYRKAVDEYGEAVKCTFKDNGKQFLETGEYVAFLKIHEKPLQDYVAVMQIQSIHA